MVPPPSPTITNDHAPEPAPRVRGERRNFSADAVRTPHKFPIGTRVFFHSKLVRMPIGPLFVVEYCKHLHALAPPQYILQPTMGPAQDASKYVMCDETMIAECKEDEPPVDIENTEACLLWHWLPENNLTN